MKADNSYDRKYAVEEYYWGRKPSSICDRVLEILHPTADRRMRLRRRGTGYFTTGDWEILFSVEEIFDCISSGIPHKHAVSRIIARRP